MEDIICVCDFDGTITKKDSVNDFLEQFADKKWREIEDNWVTGKIPTKDAYEMQFNLIENMTEEKMDYFFNNVEIDDYFQEFYSLAKENGLKVVIVSDGFEYFIKRILNRFEINDIEIFSNHFEFVKGKFTMEFPYKNTSCQRNAGTCKCSFIDKFKEKYKTIIYIGDGASDFCPAKKVNLLFAKKSLLKYCLENGINCTKYENFKEIINGIIKNAKYNRNYR